MGTSSTITASPPSYQDSAPPLQAVSGGSQQASSRTYNAPSIFSYVYEGREYPYVAGFEYEGDFTVLTRDGAAFKVQAYLLEGHCTVLRQQMQQSTVLAEPVLSLDTTNAAAHLFLLAVKGTLGPRKYAKEDIFNAISLCVASGAPHLGAAILSAWVTSATRDIFIAASECDDRLTGYKRLLVGEISFFSMRYEQVKHISPEWTWAVMKAREEVAASGHGHTFKVQDWRHYWANSAGRFLTAWDPMLGGIQYECKLPDESKTTMTLDDGREVVVMEGPGRDQLIGDFLIVSGDGYALPCYTGLLKAHSVVLRDMFQTCETDDRLLDLDEPYPAVNLFVSALYGPLTGAGSPRYANIKAAIELCDRFEAFGVGKNILAGAWSHLKHQASLNQGLALAAAMNDQLSALKMLICWGGDPREWMASEEG
ncbi:hypothetical protein IAT38_005562 [Cryptococcus sp. DSM 104549]